MKPIPFAEINRELVPKDPLEQAQFGAALFEKCRLAHNAEPKTPEGKRSRQSIWLPRIRQACSMVAKASQLLPRPAGPFDVAFDKDVFLSSSIGKNYLSVLDIDKCFIKQHHKTEEAPDPLEDFTQYTVVDPYSRFTISSSQVQVTNIGMDEDTYIYRDCGANHFDEFTHLFRVRTAAANATDAWATTWAVSNTVDDGEAWCASRAEALLLILRWNASVSSYQLIFRDNEDGSGDQMRTNVSPNTDYYITIERSGSSAFAHIYTDSDRSTLLTTLSVSPPSTRKYRYVFGPGSHDKNWPNHSISFIVAELDLSEATAFQPAWAEGVNTHIF